MEKRQILTFGYNRFIVPNTIDIETLVRQLSVLQTCDWADKPNKEHIEISAKVEIAPKSPSRVVEEELSNEPE